MLVVAFVYFPCVPDGTYDSYNPIMCLLYVQFLAVIIITFVVVVISLLKPIPTKEIWKLVHSCYGDELGVASEEDTEEFIVCPDTATGTVVNAPSVTTLISTASEGDDAKSVADLDAQVNAI